MLEDLTTAASPASWPAAYPQGYAVVDVETTGLARDDRIISAAVYRLDARGEVEDHWYTMVNPERDPGPVWIHGLTSDMLEGAPLFPEIAEEFAARLDGRVLVAHNAVFDWSMIAREYARGARGAGASAAVHHRPLQGAGPAAAQPQAGVAGRAFRGRAAARAPRAGRRPRAGRGVPAEPAGAARDGVRLPLLECLPLKEWSGSTSAPRIGRQAGGYASGGYPSGSWRPSRKRPACPYPNPGRYETGKPLKQGMRVAFSGDTSVDRELLEDRAVEAGLHVATSLSRLTSLLVTNDPDAATSKVVKARQFGTPVIDEAAFGQLLRDVEPASRG